MGHAEVVALMQLQKDAHPEMKNYHMYVSLQPCPMCLGALLMHGIKNISYAADDCFLDILGADSHGSSININKIGGIVEEFQIILQTSRGRYNPRRKLMDEWALSRKNAVDFGLKMGKEGFFEKSAQSKMEAKEVFIRVLSQYKVSEAVAYR
jgi:hypothetical protein